MRIGSLFSGIGGLELGLERAGLGVFVVGHTNGEGEPTLAVDDQASGVPSMATHAPAWPSPPDLRGVDDGLSPRVDRHRAARIKALGNAVVVTCAEVIGRVVMSEIGAP